MSCPICAKATAPPYRPFCSRRCADVDLGRWLTGAYAVAADPAQEQHEWDHDQAQDITNRKGPSY